MTRDCDLENETRTIFFLNAAEGFYMSEYKQIPKASI